MLLLVFLTGGLLAVSGCSHRVPGYDWFRFSSTDIVIDSHDKKGRVERYGDWPLGIGGGDWRDSCLFAFEGDGQCRFRWRPDIPEAGHYRVSLWFGGDPNRDHATNSPYTVSYKGGKRTIRVDQTRDSGGWLDLGIYPFEEGQEGYVELTNEANGNVVADAVRFKRVEPIAAE
jgi:hypothetical protein